MEIPAGLQKKQPPPWADADACFSCKESFGFFRRKHHCRYMSITGLVSAHVSASVRFSLYPLATYMYTSLNRTIVSLWCLSAGTAIVGIRFVMPIHSALAHYPYLVYTKVFGCARLALTGSKVACSP
jgi:hypothetical protein